MFHFSFNIIPINGDIFTKEAADSLINQRPTFNGLVVNDRMYASVGRVISAVLQPNGYICATVEIMEET